MIRNDPNRNHGLPAASPVADQRVVGNSPATGERIQVRADIPAVQRAKDATTVSLQIQNQCAQTIRREPRTNQGLLKRVER
jgi:hypothetical protein